jgi:thiamine pyrophosphokinase
MKAAIFLNGEDPSLRIVRHFTTQDSLIIAADGGGNYLYRMKLRPDVLIGDMDSIEEQAAAHYRNDKVKIVELNEQETTDFEKCLNYCCSNNIKDVKVFGAISLRPDHTLNNFSILKRFKPKMNVTLITDEFEIFIAERMLEFEYRKNETLSMMGVPFAKGIVTKGLKYRLTEEELRFGVREGSLNESISEKISISHKSGTLLIFKKHFLN